MRIDVCTWSSGLDSDRLYGKEVVVIHVLRSVTSMIWAVRNGAMRIIPVPDAGAAVDMFGRLSIPDAILAGEQDGGPIQGFLLSNSPYEYTRQTVEGKTIIMSTCNGTAAFSSTSKAKGVYLAGMINRTAVAKKLLEKDSDTVFLCVGANGETAAEDILGAGAVINALLNLAQKSGKAVSETDISFICRTLYKDWKMQSCDINQSASVKMLQRRGCDKDIDFCLTPDQTDIVPVYRDGIITI